MSRSLFIIIAIPIFIGCTSTQKISTFNSLFGDTSIITRNDGGNVLSFKEAAEEIVKEKKLIKIDGDCVSACTIFADNAREFVCITDRAKFLFHKATRQTKINKLTTVKETVLSLKEDPKMSSDIEIWVNARGGFPEKGFLVMDSSEAKKIWKPCEKD